MEYKPFYKQIFKMHDTGSSTPEIAREIIKDKRFFGVKYRDVYKQVFDIIKRRTRSGGPAAATRSPGAKEKKLTVSSRSATGPNDYENHIILSAWDPEKNRVLDLKEYCKKYNLVYEDITSYKYVSHTGTPQYNIVFKTKQVFTKDLTPEFINEAVKKYIKPIPLPREPIQPPPAGRVLRVVISDTHIGMEPDHNGFGMYGGPWNEIELEKRRKILVEKIAEQKILHGSFSEVHLIDLGDFVDGWDGLTTRGGHDLPQNMDNQKQFDIGVGFKIKLIQDIIMLNLSNTLNMFNICNDNHAGAFGYVVNSAVKQILNAMYPDAVEVNNHRQFMSHYITGKHCFILSHGKDEKLDKFGFKPVLDKKGKDKIIEYIDYNKLNDYFVTFEKGDSHQYLFDHLSSQKFNYNNYMAFSPASGWIRANFQMGRSGFSIQTFSPKEKQITETAHEFSWSREKAAI